MPGGCSALMAAPVGELLGLGLTHFPPLAWPDESMDRALQHMLADPAIPGPVKNGQGWPEGMSAQLDERLIAAAEHRAALVAGCEHVREDLDEFGPDVVLIWGDDQYEMFREDVVPAFCVVAADRFRFRPWSGPRGPVTNVWSEPPDHEHSVSGHSGFGRQLAEGLLEGGFDIAYAYEVRGDRPFPHAVANTVMFLDYARRGFNYPIVPMLVNCYGRMAIARRGGMSYFGSAGDKAPRDPPGPSPKRCIELGRAVARCALRSDLKVALVASSSWSHGFLHDGHWRLYPDRDADLRFYEALVTGDHRPWHEATLAEIEAAGQQEMLNWFCLLGAIEEAGLERSWSSFVETHVFNSNKCFAAFR